MKRSTLNRRNVVSTLLGQRGDALVVTGLGSTTWDAMAAGDNDLNFYLWGGMGGAAMTGLGLAIAQPKRRVLVVTGDGEMLMGIGSLATVAVQAPGNLSIVVIDNEHYGETGGQPTHTRAGVDLPGMAAAAGFPITETVRTKTALKSFIDTVYQAQGPILGCIKVESASEPLVLPERDGPYLKSRFRNALLEPNT